MKKKISIMMLGVMMLATPAISAISAEKSVMINGGISTANPVIDEIGETTSSFIYGGTALIGSETLKGGFRFLHGEYEGKISNTVKVKDAIEAKTETVQVLLNYTPSSCVNNKIPAKVSCTTKKICCDTEERTYVVDPAKPAEYKTVTNKATVEFNRYTVIAQKMLDDNFYVVADAGVNTVIVNDESGSGLTAGIGVGVKKHFKNSPVFIGGEVFGTYNSEIEVKDSKIEIGPTMNIIAGIGIDL